MTLSNKQIKKFSIHRNFRLALTALFFAFGLVSIAQDSIHTAVIDKDFYFFDNNTRSNLEFHDTSFNQLSNYFPRNLMGSIGLPQYDYLQQYREDQSLGVRWFSSPYNSRLFGLQQNVYFQQDKIYTNLFAAGGTKNEQVLKLFHTQNINERLNISLKLNRYGTNGFYNFQQNFVNNVLLSSNFISKNKRFGYFSTFSFDRFKHKENGGVANDSLVTDDITINKALVDVNLNHAKRNYSLLAASTSLFVRLNKDSAKISHHILLGIEGYANKSIYHDTTTYYPQILLDSTYTHDTTKFYKLSPKLSYNIGGKGWNFELGGKYDWSYWYTPDTESFYNSIIACENFAWQTQNQRFVIKQRASYIASGSNNGDYNAQLHSFYKLDFLKTIISFRGSIEQRSPDLFFNYNSVNNYYWKNNFSKMNSFNNELKIVSDKLHLEIGAVYNSYQNYIYIDSSARATQLTGNSSAVRFFLNHHLKIYKFHLTNSLNYQQSSSKAIAVFPIYTQHQLYFEHRVKKNGLKLQIGVQATYVGKTDIISYNPALNSYYMLYRKEKSGNYVFADFFLSISFKPVKFFFRAEHLNQGFTGSNYSLLNGYYQPDRVFHFGLNWEFWN